MRYGLISDIHANLPALEAALKVLERVDVDEYLCAGDLVGYGPMPNECVARIAELQATCVAGNHDLIALGLPPDDGVSNLARESLRWTQAELSEESKRYLEALPAVVTTGSGVVIAHGSLDDPGEYVRDEVQRCEQLRLLEADHPDARFLVLGHTHRSAIQGAERGTVPLRWKRSVNLTPRERYLFNPGSVGQSRQRTARSRFMVLDLARGRATFYAVRYDVGACRRALRERGLPSWSFHTRPVRWRRWAGVLRRSLQSSR